MTNAERSTSYTDSINWTARMEATLDKARADLDRFQEEHPGEGVDVQVIDAVIDKIFSRPVLETLGDLRLFAKAWLEFYQDEIPDRDRPLLAALVALPPGLWHEKIRPDDPGPILFRPEIGDDDELRRLRKMTDDAILMPSLLSI